MSLPNFHCLASPVAHAALSLVLCTGAAVAACGSSDVTVLSCTARNGSKAVNVCLNGSYLHYAYGPRGGAPELELSEHVVDVLHEPWPGIGRSIWEATTFRNAGYGYRVYISLDRSDRNGVTSGGVEVLKGEETIATVDCDAGSDTIGLWAVMEAKEAHGVCWDHGTFSWGSCGN